jgi:hypothetical protein
MSTELRTFSIDKNLPFRSALQMFIDLWAEGDSSARLEAVNFCAELCTIDNEPVEYVVTFPVNNQLTESSWEVLNPSLKINSNTRVSAICNFYRKHLPVPPMEVKIIQLQTR